MTNAALLNGSKRLLLGTENGRTLSYGEHLDLHGPLQLPHHKGLGSWRAQLLQELETSGLTGKGGGGFSTAIKLGANSHGLRKPVMVVNIMEGEPAARKDSVLACFSPHLILDGAEVIATLVHAHSITVAIARDNPAAVASLERAVLERRGRRTSPFTISIATPPNRYVAGEESALAHWLDGQLALPTFRLHKPAKLPVGTRGAVIDNAETCADVALVARRGGAWFHQGGRNGAPGTTLVTISGAVEDDGVFEVPLGAPLSEIVALAGPSTTLTGFLLGGYGGTFVGPEALSAAYSPAGLKAIGGNVGAGVIIVLDQSVCPVAEVARITRWMANESAGQCGPCVFGLPALADEIETLAKSKGRRSDLMASIEHHLEAVDGRGACAHPDGVARMIRSALNVFRHDVDQHLAGRPCGAHGAQSVMNLPPNAEGLEWK
jgi:NADH:ubiquinone oxidoreductase subunit F (NADH-binding)